MPANAGISRCETKKASEHFFFEKKQQKAFIYFAPEAWHNAGEAKFFCLFFLFTKNKTLTPLEQSISRYCERKCDAKKTLILPLVRRRWLTVSGKLCRTVWLSQLH